jgi:hypothetical protein
MHGGTFFLVSVFGPFWITSSNALDSEAVGANRLREGRQGRLEGLAVGATLLLLNIVHVRVAEESNHAEEETQVTIAGVVVGPGLVPLGEGTHLLVGQGSSIAHLKVTGNPNTDR